MPADYPAEKKIQIYKIKFDMCDRSQFMYTVRRSVCWWGFWRTLMQGMMVSSVRYYKRRWEWEWQSYNILFIRIFSVVGLMVWIKQGLGITPLYCALWYEEELWLLQKPHTLTRKHTQNQNSNDHSSLSLNHDEAALSFSVQKHKSNFKRGPITNATRQP